MMGPSGSGSSNFSLPGVHDAYSLLSLIVKDPKRYEKAVKELKKLAEEIGERQDTKSLITGLARLEADQARISELSKTAQTVHDNLIAEAQFEAKRIVEIAKTSSDELLAQTESAHKLVAVSLREAAEAEKASKRTKVEAETARQAALEVLRDAEGQKRAWHGKMKQFEALARAS